MARTRTTWRKGAKTGRPKGLENKITRDIKEAYKQLVEMNLDNMKVWLESVAIDNPEKAIYIITTLSEYVIPKLARTEADVTNKIELMNKSVQDLFPPVVIDNIEGDKVSDKS